MNIRMNIHRATLDDLATAQSLLHEYYAAVDVQKRDTPRELRDYITATGAGFWIVQVDGISAGCIALRPLPGLLHAAECKRLYVRPSYRGLGLAAALLNALETHAKLSGYDWLYLDSTDDLKAAVCLYLQRGYAPCERYNSNPQATIFLRKYLLSTATTHT